MIRRLNDWNARRVEQREWRKRQDRVREAVRDWQTVEIASTRIKTRFHEH